MDDEPDPIADEPARTEDVAPDDPVPSSRSAGRQVGLAAVAFVATLALLFGLASLLARDPGTGPTTSAAGTGASASGGASPSSPSSTGSPGPSPSADPVLIGAGDIADCSRSDDAATAALVDGIPGTVFTAGDNVTDGGSAEEFTDCYAPTWGRFQGRTHPAPGDRDHATKDMAGYNGFFGVAAKPNGTNWYAYDLGTWHIIVLDSACDVVGGCGPDSAQGRWLAADLAASNASCTLAVWHLPRWSSGDNGSEASVAPFWTALYGAGADIVVNAHDNDYERFAPQDPDGRADGAKGIREFVVGTGGAPLGTFPTTAANSELRLAVAHGVIRFVLKDGSYQWQFIPTTGEVTDAGTGFCH